MIVLVDFVNLKHFFNFRWIICCFADQTMEIYRVRLTRPSITCPWGIVITGTDDVINAPVIIDSLAPGKPGALCGLLKPGDKILSVNDVSVTKGLTLSQVMSKLQQPSEQVLFYLARPKELQGKHVDSKSSSTKQSRTTVSLDYIYHKSRFIWDNFLTRG